MKLGRVLAIVAGVLIGLVALAVVVVAGVAFASHRPLPEGAPGPRAEALAQELYDSVDAQAWERTGAVAWTFPGDRRHLWDRQRQLDRYQNGDLTVWIDLDSRWGVAERGGVRLEGDARDQALQTAWAAWANDSFWLNPVVKIFDEGASRSLVTLDDGREGLLVTYASGGVTPGDSYLWIPGGEAQGGRPVACRMWVQVFPVGGLEVSWDGWRELDTGAWVATRHATGLGLEIEIADLRAAPGVLDLESRDPFAVLVDPE